MDADKLKKHIEELNAILERGEKKRRKSLRICVALAILGIIINLINIIYLLS